MRKLLRKPLLYRLDNGVVNAGLEYIYILYTQYSSSGEVGGVCRLPRQHWGSRVRGGGA